MEPRALLLDLAIGLAAGYAATQVTQAIQPVLYRLTPRAIKQREESVRPGQPSRIAAKKIGKQMGIAMRGKWLARAASAVHCGTGLAWGPVYGLLRRFSGMRPWWAGLATGAAMSLIVDETLSPALGCSAPGGEYPVATHARGLITHLLFGLTVAASAEALTHWLRRD